LSKIIVRSKEIPIYENCFKRRFRSYAVLPLDSSRCIEYIRSNRLRCDVISPTAVQFEALSSIYICLETELEDVLKKQIQESFYIVRFQVQKKM